MTRTRKVLLGGISVVTAGAAATAAIGLSAQSKTTSQRLNDPGFTAAPIGSVPAAEADSFEIFRSAGPSSPDPIAAQVGHAAIYGEKFAPNPALARVLPITNPTGRAQPRLVAGNDGLCLVVPDTEGSAISCKTLAEAQAGRLFVALFPNHGVPMLIGVAPDGAEVRTTDADGATLDRAAVELNGYTVALGNSRFLAVGSNSFPLPVDPNG